MGNVDGGVRSYTRYFYRLRLSEDELQGIFDEDTAGMPSLSPLPLSLDGLVEQEARTSKTDRCITLADRLLSEGKPVVIWCFFKKSMHNIKRHLCELGWTAEVISGEVDQQHRDEILSGFKAGRIMALITNPHTLAESVSLHKVCHDAIYFEYSYNLVHLLQSKDRIHRLGLSAGQYTQYYFLQSIFDVDGAE